MNEIKKSSGELQKRTSKLTLKEEILYRKFRQDRQMLNSQKKQFNKTSIKSKRASENTEAAQEADTRMKLIKNRVELDELLQNVPSLLKQGKEKSSLKELKPPSVTSTTTPFLESPEDSKPPVLAPPIVEMNKLKPSDTKLQSLKVGSERVLPSASNNQLDNHKATNNNTNDVDKSSSLLSSRAGNYFYEVAKPKPPPRLSRKRQSKSFPSEGEMKSSDFGFNDTKSITSSSVPREEDESSGKERQLDTADAESKKIDRESTSDRYTMKSDVDDSFPEHASYLSISHASFTSHTTQHKKSIPSPHPPKFETSSNTNSSGYLSQRSGSVSLSSSNSNASSTASSKFPVASDGELRRNSSNTVKNRLKLLYPQNGVKQTKNNDVVATDDEDVFSVNSWIESSEYATIAQKNAIEEDDPRNEDLEQMSIPSPMKIKNKKQSPTNTHKTSSHRQIANRISMVERQVSDERPRSAVFSGNVKLRMPGTRTKKNDASRNSLAFARQLNQLSEDADSIKARSHSDIHRNSDTDPSIRKNENARKASVLPTLVKSDSLVTSKPRSDSFAHSSEKLYNTVSGATGRHLSEKSRFFNDSLGGEVKKENPSISAIKSEFNDSTWSLSSNLSQAESEQPRVRRPSIKDRLKGAFSFQNLRRAISMERLNDEARNKSLSHSYLNEFDQDIAEIPSNHRPKIVNNKPTKPSSTIKTSSVSSILSTVRMRKRKSRERREAKARHTIAVDSKNSEYDFSQYSATNETESRKTGSLTHTRPIGRILEMNVNEGSLLIEMVKTSSAPFGFYLARKKETGSVYISSMSENGPNTLYAGLMKLGDEITEVNHVKVDRLTLDAIYDIISESKTLLLRIKSQVHVV